MVAYIDLCCCYAGLQEAAPISALPERCGLGRLQKESGLEPVNGVLLLVADFSSELTAGFFVPRPFRYPSLSYKR